MYLTRTFAHVHVMVRVDGLASTMSDYLLSRLRAHSKITIHTGTQVTELHGREALEAVTISTPEGARQMEMSALFVMVGAAPNTEWLSGLIDLDTNRFVPTGRDAGGRTQYETSCPGVFAVGDVRSGSVKRVASAVGEGSVVTSAVWVHIND